MTSSRRHRGAGTRLVLRTLHLPDHHEFVVFSTIDRIALPSTATAAGSSASFLADLERRAELVRANVITASENEIADHQSTPLADHFTAFEAFLRAKCVTKVYLANTRRYLDQLALDCNFLRLSDLRREAFEAWLVTKIDAGVSARTRNAN